MSIQAAPRVRTVRRINRADSRVREDDTGVKAKQENEGEEREANVQRGQNVNRINRQGGTIGNKNMISERENENKNKTPRGAFITKTETRKQEGNKNTKNALKENKQKMSKTPAETSEHKTKTKEGKTQNMTKTQEGNIENMTNEQEVKTQNMNKTQENRKKSMIKTQEGKTPNMTKIQELNIRKTNKLFDGQNFTADDGQETRLNKGRVCQKLDFETLCCHHCDDSLAGQRYVLKEDNPYCTKCYESIFANTCNQCSKVISIDCKDLSYKGKHWHSSCFICTKCKSSVVDKQFGSKADQIYCGPCHEELFGSRCTGCGETFRAGMKKMEYKGRQWHEDCFTCCTCEANIGSNSFIPSGSDIFCNSCYEEAYAAKCAGCSKAVTSGGLTYLNQPWHKECFSCTNCKQSLAGHSFTSRHDQPYCADCAGHLFSKQCNACAKSITGIGGTRFVSFAGRHWHSSCFSCSSCSTSLVGNGFVAEEKEILCTDCAKTRMEADRVDT